MSKKTNIFFLLSLLTLFIFACTLPASQSEKNDPNIVFTAAAQTASVQLTERAAMVGVETQTPLPPLLPPTLPPPTQTLPQITPTEDDCDKAKFITDVTVPDGTVFTPGETFTKTWRVKNIGTCTWTTGYALVFDGGTQMGGLSPKTLMGNVAPGATVDLSVNFTAPPTNGSYRGNWQIRNTSNVLFAKIYVQIKVGNSGDFAVTSVSDMDAYYIMGHGAALVAKITVSKAGKVEYHWILRETGQPDLTTAIEEIDFASNGTKEISTLWASCPHAGSFKASLYIDEPNHQEFGQANFSCP